MKKKKSKDIEHDNGGCLLEAFLKILLCYIWFFMLPTLKVFKIIDIDWNSAFCTVTYPMLGISMFVVFTTIYNSIESAFRNTKNEKN